MKRAATTRRYWRCPATCRAICTAPISSRRPSPICCFATSRSTPKLSLLAAQAPAVIHQAIAAAYAGPGVAHLTLPQDVIAAKAEGDVSSVATLKPRTEITASETDVAEIARRIDAVRQRGDHVRRRVPWRRRCAARAVGSS